MDWFPYCLFLGALGIAGTLPLIPTKGFVANFYQRHYTIALVVMVLAIVLARPIIRGLPETPLAIIADLSFFGFGLTILLMTIVTRAVKGDVPKDALWLPISVGVPALVFMAFQMTTGQGIGMRILFTAHLATSAAMLGTTLVAMMLGHWYLNNAALSFDHLIRLCRSVVIVSIVSLVVTGIYFVIQYDYFRPMLFEFDGMMIGLRVGAGLIMVLVMGWMSLTCAKEKSNQSATGILYVVVMFAIIGEMVSMYHTLYRGTPI